MQIDFFNERASSLVDEEGEPRGECGWVWEEQCAYCPCSETDERTDEPDPMRGEPSFWDIED